MKGLWLGASIEKARCVFLLPNRPILPGANDELTVATYDVAALIDLNGNHWRKIFTIIAKLVVPTYFNWREFRDNNLLNEVGIAFSIDQIKDYEGVVYVVGNTFRDIFPVSALAKVLGDRHLAYVSLPYIWSPYLDYRQFPNILIESLREYTLEK
jgi:hypothetical protein